jgi:hypothetical protein
VPVFSAGRASQPAKMGLKEHKVRVWAELPLSLSSAGVPPGEAIQRVGCRSRHWIYPADLAWAGDGDACARASSACRARGKTPANHLGKGVAMPKDGNMKEAVKSLPV